MGGLDFRPPFLFLNSPKAFPISRKKLGAQEWFCPFFKTGCITWEIMGDQMEIRVRLKY